jgi:hypothetical protein
VKRLARHARCAPPDVDPAATGPLAEAARTAVPRACTLADADDVR